MHPTLLIYQNLTHTIPSFADTAQAMNEISWISKVLENSGQLGAFLAGLVGVLFVLVKFLGPVHEKREERKLAREDAEIALIKLAADNEKMIPLAIQEMRQDIAYLARAYERVAGKVERNCSHHEPPESTTEADVIQKIRDRGRRKPPENKP